MAISITSFSATVYIYNEYRILDQNYQALQQNVDNVSINIDLIINFGNGTILYFNQTRIPVGFNMINSTHLIIGEDQVDSIYYSEFNAYFVNVILGTGNDSNFAWSAWKYEICCEWELLEIGANLYMPEDGSTIAWYYQGVNEFGQGKPN